MKTKFLLLLFCVTLTGFSQKQKTNTSSRLSIEPQHWYAGMNNKDLQLMVYGKGIGAATVEVNGSNARLREVVACDSPDYLLLYLDLTDAVAGNVALSFRTGKRVERMTYELRPRNNARLDNRSYTTDDVLYLIMPDRFANGDSANDNSPQIKHPSPVNRLDPNARHGGDLKGIEDRLDYLSDLGVTALWLNPVLENDMKGGAYHGYATTNYYRVDPRFGSNDDYIRLIQKAHQKGLRIVMDMIFNHCGSEHVWMANPPFNDWFNNLPSDHQPYVQTNHYKESLFDPYCSDLDKREMVDGWFVPSMPDLNQRNPHLATYLIQNSIWWIEYAGIDGIRQDTHPYPDFVMMSRWCEAVRNEYPSFNIVGEAWIGTSAGSAFFQKGKAFGTNTVDSHLPSVMDFRLQGMASEVFAQETGWGSGLSRIHEHLAYDFLFPDINNVLTFLDNHDTDRFLRTQPQNLDAYKQALTFLLTSRGIPQLYYGTEILMNGTKARSDGDIRLDFPGGWATDSINAFSAEGRSAMQNEAFNFLRKLLHWRKGNEVITKGSLKHFVPTNGLYLYARTYQEKTVLVLMNGTGKTLRVDARRYAEAIGQRSEWTDLLSDRTIVLGNTIELAPRQTYILY